MFDVDISDKQVVFAAFEGTVRVESKDAAVQPVLLQPSEETILLKDAATRGVPYKRTIRPDKMKRVVEWVARVEKLTHPSQ